MELIRISDSKLKIMLTPTDMCHFELNADRIGEDSEQTRRAFRLLMTEIKRQTGLEADDTGISVQYFPSREGGCEMFVTHLHTLPPQTDSKEEHSSPERALQIRPFGRAGTAFHRDLAYRFEALSDLLAVCKRLFEVRYIGSSSAFSDEGGRYFLFLTFLCASPFSLPDELGFLAEYGNPENASLIRLYLQEHGRALCDTDAVARLSPLA